MAFAAATPITSVDLPALVTRSRRSVPGLASSTICQIAMASVSRAATIITTDEATDSPRVVAVRVEVSTVVPSAAAWPHSATALATADTVAGGKVLRAAPRPTPAAMAMA